MSFSVSRFVSTTPETIELNEVTTLIFSSFARFYDTLPVPPEVRLKLIAGQLCAGIGELSDTWVAFDNGKVCGVFSAYASTKISARQMASIQHLRRALTKEDRGIFDDGVRARFGATAKPARESFYLARFAVGEAYFGTGMASRLFSEFIRIGGAFGAYSLHVSEENKRAIGFYRKSGLKVMYDSLSNGYLLMEGTLENLTV